jgi:outer membrane protein assembly factor BamE (lipoprotein component of BamABCDE complex)
MKFKYLNKMDGKISRRAVLSGLSALFLGACASQVDYRGYIPRADDMKALKVGMNRGEVEAILGSPSTKGSVFSNQDTFYYISSIVEQKAFFRPQVKDREVLAVRFTENKASSFNHYGLEDGKVINVSSRQTPVRGKELSVLQDIFGNLGKFN